MTGELLRTDIVDEAGVLRARQLGRAVAEQVGLDAQDQIRVATALSEVGRDLYAYAGAVSVQFSLEPGVPAAYSRPSTFGPFPRDRSAPDCLTPSVSP